MNKAVKRIVSILMVCLIFFGMLSAFAAEPSIEPFRASDYLWSYTASVTAGSGGAVSVTVNVVGTGIMTSIGASQIIIRESTDGGSTWSNVKTYTSSNTSGMLKSNTSSYYATPVIYSGTAGYKYQALVTVYAANSNGSDTSGYLTSSVTAVK